MYRTIINEGREAFLNAKQYGYAVSNPYPHNTEQYGLWSLGFSQEDTDHHDAVRSLTATFH